MARKLTREQLRAIHAAAQRGEISLSSRDTKLNREAEKVGASIHRANRIAIMKNNLLLDNLIDKKISRLEDKQRALSGKEIGEKEFLESMSSSRRRII